MSESDKYSVILPTYNEKENLPIITYLIMEMAEEHKLDLEIVIVDDNSPDGTGDVADQLARIYQDKIIVHKRPGKLGLGSAYIDGLNDCRGNYVILMDADFSHHPKYIPKLIRRMEWTGAEIVTGTRYIENAGVYGWDLKRKLTSRCANFLAKTAMGSDCSDLTGSFRLYTKEAISAIMPQIISRGYAFQMEIVMRAQALGYKIEEVPIVFVDRIFGESKLGSNEIVMYLKGVWKLFNTF